MAALSFLGLCQRLRQDCVGVSGTGPSSVTGQTGDMKRIVDWVSAAYEDIQNLHHDWDFLRGEVSFTTTASKQEYTPAECGITDFAEWNDDTFRCYPTATGAGGEQHLTQDSWPAFRDRWMFGTARTQEGQPNNIARKPNGSLVLWQIPDGQYTVNGEYWKTPDVMATDAAVPIFPARFHLIIVYRALVAYAGHSASPETYTTAGLEYTRMLHMLKRDQHWKVRGP